MSTRIWPDVLPGVSVPGYRLRPADQSIRTQMEVGPRRLRRISAAGSDDVTVSWVFKDAEMSAFRAWFADAPWSLTGASDDVTGWTLDGASVVADYAVGPDISWPDKLREDSSTGQHAIERAAEGAIEGDVVRITLSAGPAGRDGLRLGLVGCDGTWRWVDINTATGVVLGSSNAGSIAVERRIPGWWRIVASFATGAGAAIPKVRLATLDGAGAVSYRGNGSAGVKLAEVNTRVETGFDLFLRTSGSGTALGAAGGSAWFRMPLAFGGGVKTIEARFLEMYGAAPSPSLGWTVQGSLEVRDA